MKIGLISFSPPYTIPYLDYYLGLINNNQCDVIFWDRDCNYTFNSENASVNYISYSCKVSGNIIAKTINYYSVTKFIRKQLKNNKYDRVIFLQTHAAVACKKIILKYYRKKYIVDIRDFTLENIFIYRRWEKSVIENSYATIISSEGYKHFLPKYDYTLVHNFKKIEEVSLDTKKDSSIINISFIGNVRFFEIAKKLILIFKNDKRFWLSFIGNGSQNLEKFCKENQVENVTLIGKFSPDETIKYYMNCSIVNNYYGNKNNYLDYALSNKLYYSAQLNIPVLVNENTYSSKIAEEYGFGITWNADAEDAREWLYQKYLSIDKERMKKGCEAFIRKVEQENNIFEKKIKMFVEEK